MDAGRDVDPQPAHAALRAACRRRSGTDPRSPCPMPWQLEHGWEIEKIPWLWASTPAALADRAHLRRGAGLGAGAVTRGARLRGRHRERHLRAVDRLVEAQRDLGLEVAAALRRAPCAHATLASAGHRAAPRHRRRTGWRGCPRSCRRTSPDRSRRRPCRSPNGPVPRSYALRLSGSDSTSWACEISLKRSSAFLSPGLRSGWYWRASLR